MMTDHLHHTEKEAERGEIKNGWKERETLRKKDGRREEN
jgi:hypothetical protein